MTSLKNLQFLGNHLNTINDSNHEYINVQIINEYTETNNAPQAIIFNQVKTSNIIDVCSDYYLSVVRWNIQSNLPVLIPDMVLYPILQQPGTLDTQYKLTMFYSTLTGDLPLDISYTNPNVPYLECTVYFKPETISANYLNNSFISPQTKNDTLNNPFFYIKSVDTFLDMLNSTIFTFMNQLYTVTGGATWTHLPYFIWDAGSGKITYNNPNSSPTGGTLGPGSLKWFLAVNQSLYNLLNTFRFKYYPRNAGNAAIYPEASNCRYLLDTNILDPLTTEAGIGEYSSYLQQSSSVVNWSPVSSIVFQTGLPVEAQISGAPTNLNLKPATNASTYQQQNTTKILTDFAIPFSIGTEATNQQIYYTPTSEYRLIDLLGNNNLNQLTVQIFWRDKFGGIHPMTLDAGAAADMLILLRKKSFN